MSFRAAALAALLFVASVSHAVCPDDPADCLAGGGSPATDCYVAFAGIPSLDVTCTDGDPSCDTDGHVDGVCTFGLQACVDVPQAGCTPAALTSPRVAPKKGDGAVLVVALASVAGAGTGCTAPGFAVPLKAAIAGLKPAVVRLKVSVAGGGKRDTDKVKLTCLPGVPSFANDVQPILTAKCAFAGCHSSASAKQSLVLDPGVAYGQLVNRQTTEGGRLLIVEPGSVKSSYMARKILGRHIAPGTTIMPQGCPGAPQMPDGCLTPADVAKILSWIQGQAPAN
jgi:hypothetical protein